MADRAVAPIRRGRETGIDHAPPQPAIRDDESADFGIMLRSLIVIWGIVATFLLVVLLVTQPPRGTRTTLLCLDIIGFTVLALLLVARDRVPHWTSDVCAYLLYLVVGGVIVAYEDPHTPYAFFYLWLSVHSFYFLPWRRAAPQVAFIAGDYAVSLLAIPGAEFPLLRWAVLVMTTVAICTLVAMLRARVDRLVGRLAAVARTDPLTGLGNRRAYEELIEMEVVRSDRTGRSFALIVGDLDHFKSVNDRFGHPAGDEVLRRVATQLQNVTRRSDIALRLGGEEFAVLVPETDCRGAAALANRLGDAVRHEFANEPVGVTMSFGVACYPEDGEKADALFEAADTALLAAKAHGRDQAVVYGVGRSGSSCRDVPDPKVRPR